MLPNYDKGLQSPATPAEAILKQRLPAGPWGWRLADIGRLGMKLLYYSRGPNI